MVDASLLTALMSTHRSITPRYSANRANPRLLSDMARARKLRHGLRTTLWLVLLCFTLGTLAHSGHLHTPTKSTHEQCDLCVGFGSTMSPPTVDIEPIAPATADALLITTKHIALSRRVAGLPQARAPPHSC